MKDHRSVFLYDFQDQMESFKREDVFKTSIIHLQRLNKLYRDDFCSYFSHLVLRLKCPIGFCLIFFPNK